MSKEDIEKIKHVLKQMAQLAIQLDDLGIKDVHYVITPNDTHAYIIHGDKIIRN